MYLDEKNEKATGENCNDRIAVRVPTKIGNQNIRGASSFIGEKCAIKYKNLLVFEISQMNN